MKILLVFLAGLLVGANAVYFLMTWGDADPDAAVVFERERSQHTGPAPAPPTGTPPASRVVDPTRQSVTPPPAGVDAPPLSPALSTAPSSTAPPSASASTPTVAAVGAELIVPVRGIQLAQLDNTFDDARGQGRVHEAIDIMAPRGTPVLAATDGKVEKLFTSVPGGLTIYQFDPDGRHAYYYAHLDRYATGVVEGRVLKRGEVIGYVGSTGNASEDAPHLHFAIFVLGPEKRWWEGTAINPYPILTGKQPL
ncbi:peptidoglycan DD-metalloendopeptidase family protein [Lysobacter sp. F6437]|uniref:peptidoglycan DD-metalloendopeptidase family protein n=1 Tax=Lysobacter sp. F6437 TaxID=3459296 RepID=UPI00403D97D9